jgi:NhaP-type Na+/H+ or K+/H+ antiporter
MGRFSFICLLLCFVTILLLAETTVDASSSSSSSNAGTTNGTTVHGHVGPHAGQTEVNTICLMLAIGVLCRRYVVPLFCGYMPYTVALLIVGMFIGASHNWTRYRYSIDSNGVETSHHDRKCNVDLEPYGTCRSMWDELHIQVMHDVSPHTLVFVFLPALIFESSYFTNTHILFNNFTGVSIMAVIGVVVSIAITAGFLYIVPQFWVAKDEDSITYAAWGFGPVAFMLGSIFSATDPVAVVALLKELGASEELGVLIEGESLLNDGTAYAAFVIMQSVTRSAFAKHGVPTNDHFTPLIPNAFVSGAMCNQSNTGTFPLDGDTFCTEYVPASGILKFFYLVIAGIAIGCLFGMVATQAIKGTVNDAVSELTVTLIAGYGSFCICEAAHASGVLGVVATGLYMSSKRTTLSPDVEEFVEEFWEMLGWLLNTLIFIIAGKIVGYIFGDALNRVTLTDLWLTLYIYVACHVARGIAILVAQPFINKDCCGGKCAYYDFNWRHSVVMWWGGLRGAVGLALAMIVSEDSYWDQPWIDTDARATFKEGTVYHVGLIATMTLVINGPLTGPLVRYLGLDKARNSELVDKVFDRQCAMMDQVLRQKVDEMSLRNKSGGFEGGDGSHENVGNAVDDSDSPSSTSDSHSSTSETKTSTGTTTTQKKGRKKSIVFKKKFNKDNDGDDNMSSPPHPSHRSSSDMFAHVNWKLAYSYTPAASKSVVENRLRHHEINPEWLDLTVSTSEVFTTRFAWCCCCCTSHNSVSGDLPWELVPQWQEYAQMMIAQGKKENKSKPKPAGKKKNAPNPKNSPNNHNNPLAPALSSRSTPSDDIERQEISDCGSFADLLGSTSRRIEKFQIDENACETPQESNSIHKGDAAHILQGYHELSSMARRQITQAANVGLSRQRFSTMIRHGYKELFEEGVLCRSVYDTLSSAEDGFDDSLEHFFYVFSKPALVKSMMLKNSKYGRSSNSENSFTQLDDFKVDHRLNQFTRSLSSKATVSSRYVYWAQTNKCVSFLVARHLRKQIELAYGITSAFVQSWTHVIHSCMADESSISHDNTIRMMVLVEAEREVAAAQQVCEGLLSVYQECIATYQTFQAARVMIMSERKTAKHFLEHAKISKIQCDSILEQCNRAYIRLLSHRPVRQNIVPSIKELVAPLKKVKTASTADFVQMVQQVPAVAQDEICSIMGKAKLIPLGRNQFVKCTKITKNTFDVSLPFHGAGFCFVARGCLLATEVIGPMLHKKESREAMYLEDLARFSFIVMRDRAMGEKISKVFNRTTRAMSDMAHGGGHGTGHGGHYSVNGSEFEEMNNVFFALPDRKQLDATNRSDFTDLQEIVLETLDSGADMDGDDHISMVEMLDFLRLRTFSKKKQIRMLAKYECGSIVPGIDVLITKKPNDASAANTCVERSHVLACRTEAIVYTCSTEDVQKLVAVIPHFESLLWKKSAVLGIKRFCANTDAKTIPFSVLNALVQSSRVVKKIDVELTENEHAIVYKFDATKVQGTPWGNNWEYVVGPSNISMQSRPHDRAVVFPMPDKDLDRLLRTSVNQQNNRENSLNLKSKDKDSPKPKPRRSKKQTRGSVAHGQKVFTVMGETIE